MKNLSHLLYWIEEREKVRKRKEAGEPKPWSDDRIFQVTYFCNVRREDDRVTKFIRQMYSPHVHHGLFVHNIILSRFLNWPMTLHFLKYVDPWNPQYVKHALNELKISGIKVWGNAYVVTTHGIKMDKIDYLCDRVMPSIAEAGERLEFEHQSCYEMAMGLQSIEGISTFMAGQVVADLKNTEMHPLMLANDWWDFALPGPGSIRGMDWLYGESVPRREWHTRLLDVQEEIGEQLNEDICAQDTQNCLCEFDKYMRIKHGTGRSKRRYDGA